MKKILSLAITGILSLGLFCSSCYATPPSQPFTPEEDKRLIQLVSEHGNKWVTIAELLGNNRTRKQCRRRYLLTLNPSINHELWTDEEDQLIMQKYNEFGPKWALISKSFTNRTDLQLRNRFIALNKRNISAQPLLPAQSSLQQNEESDSKNAVYMRKLFSSGEDQRLLQLVLERGNNWVTIANLLGNNRSPNVCRGRYLSNLDARINRGPWTAEEDQLIMQKYNEFGPKWTLISNSFNNRTPERIKDRFRVLNGRNPITTSSATCTALTTCKGVEAN